MSEPKMALPPIPPAPAPAPAPERRLLPELVYIKRARRSVP